MVVTIINTEEKIIEIVCYHGTTTENMIKIKSNHHFIESTKDTEWLGKGIYFFHEKKDAHWWTTHSRFKGQQTSVLTCTLQVEKYEILDLDDPKTLRNMQKRMYAVLKKSTDIGVKMAKMEEHERQCLFCNLIQKLMPEISLRCFSFSTPFDSENPRDFGFSVKQKQYCVVKQNIIKSIN